MTKEQDVQYTPETVSAQQRIAIISHTHPSVTKGGAEIAAYSVYLGLRELGEDAIFVAACSSRDRGRLSLASSREFAITVEPERYEHFYQLGEPAVTRQLQRILVRERVTVSNFHHYLNFGSNALRALKSAVMHEASELCSLKIILTLHELLAICHHHGQMVTRPQRRLCFEATPQECAACFPEHTPQQFEQRRDMMLKSIGGLTAYISPSRFLADRMVRWGLPEDRIEVIENGVFKAQPRRASRPAHVPGSPFVFGYFGQITPFKGVDIILDAVDLIGKQELLRDKVEIRIHGNMVGQSQAFNDRFQDSLRKHMFLAHFGPYNNANVASLMSKCDYVVVPSTWWENSPLVIQEAFMAGCPVICSGIGGMAEKVQDGVSGLHVQVGSGADLMRALKEGTNAKLYTKLANALPHVDDHVQMARAYLGVFNRAAHHRPLEGQTGIRH